MKNLNCDKDLSILRLNTIQRNSNDSFFDYDMENKVSHLTAHGVENFGMPAEVPGMPESFAEQFIIEEDREVFLDMYKRMYETKSEVHSLYRLKDGNGFIHWDECTMIPVSDKLAIGYIKDITDKKLLEIQLEMMDQLTIVEGLLMSTHREEDSLGKALKVISDFLCCNSSFIFTVEGDTHLTDQSSIIGDEYLKLARDTAVSRSYPRLPLLMKELTKGTLYINKDDIEQYAVMFPNVYKLFVGSNLKGLHLLPLYKEGQKVMGFIALASADISKVNAYFLQLISLSFSRAFDNLEEQKKIDKLNSYDLSTGLLNRNRYLGFISRFRPDGIKLLSCVVFDVNGLHEYNNRHGHSLGDDLLSKVADSLKLSFGSNHLFRTGGDEFVAVCIGEDEERIAERCATLKEDLRLQDIYISCGSCTRRSDMNIEEMLKIADRAMYADKDLFYQSRRDMQKR